MPYEDLLIESEKEDLIVKEKNIPGFGGRIYQNRIAIHKQLGTQKEKACVLAEELGHHYTSTGDILDQSNPAARKQELHARLWGYNKMVGLHGIVSAYRHHCRNLAEMADYLDVTELFLAECLEVYRRKYGCCVELDNYVIMFEPRLAVVERFEDTEDL